MNKRKQILLLVFLFLLLFAINYKFLDTKVVEFLDESDTGIVQRVIDGDTFVFQNDTQVRLLGINTPEKGELYHDEAMNFLKNLTLNKTVKLEYIGDKYDKYGRTLAYVILNGENINLEIVRNGFANFYIYDNDKYTIGLKQAWNECVSKEINLCEKSQEECASCVELNNLDMKKQNATFYNKCNFDCNLNGWNIKDEGRKNFFFQNFILQGNKEVSVVVGNKTNSENVLYWKGEDYVWTSTGDTLFLRDDKGKLVLWREINR